MVPVHFGMFSLSTHKWNDVLKIAGKDTLIAKIGKLYSFDAHAETDAAWLD